MSSRENSTRTFFESISPLESKTTVSMVDPQTQGKTFSEVVEGESSWQDENAPDLLMREAIDLALDEFMKKMAYHFYQRGYVIQTVGGGR